MIDESVFRIIDANLNRLKEGLRVAEDIARYSLSDAKLSLQIKELRHKSKISNKNFIQFRDIKSDVGKKSTQSEQQRLNLNDILIANLKRAQESSRVLEECFKLVDLSLSELFKEIRYELYEVEKHI